MVPLHDRASDLIASTGFLGLSGALLAVNYYIGFLSMSLYVDLGAMALAVVFLEAEIALLSFAAFVAVSGAVFLLGSERTGRIRHATDAGRVTAIVPVYREAGVLTRSVRSLLDADYEDLKVAIVVEPDDRKSRTRAEELADDDRVEVLVNTRAPGSKAGAINHALAATTSPYVAVFDADERVHERFLSAAVGRLRAGSDVVQGRTVPEPTGLVEAVAYYESVVLNYVALRPLYILTGFRMAASRAVVCRRGALTAVGGYDETMLTEDFAFAHECYRERLTVTELLAYPSRIDAAHSLRDWWGQRKRWMTGYAQVLHRLVASVRPIADYRNPLSAVIGAATVLGSLFMLTLLSKVAVLLVVGSRFGLLVPLGAVAAVCYLVRWRDYRRGLVSRPTWHGLLVPFILPTYSLAAIRAVFGYLFSWRGGWYRVSKEA